MDEGQRLRGYSGNHREKLDELRPKKKVVQDEKEATKDLKAVSTDLHQMTVRHEARVRQLEANRDGLVKKKGTDTTKEEEMLEASRVRETQEREKIRKHFKGLGR